MKRMVLFLPLVLFCGCGLTQKETDEIIAKSTALASDHAGQIAGKIVYDQAVKDGKSIEEATAMAKKATDIADTASKAVASAAALKAAADLEGAKGEKAGSTFGMILMTVLSVGGAVLKKVLA